MMIINSREKFNLAEITLFRLIDCIVYKNIVEHPLMKSHIQLIEDLEAHIFDRRILRK